MTQAIEKLLTKLCPYKEMQDLILAIWLAQASIKFNNNVRKPLPNRPGLESHTSQKHHWCHEIRQSQSGRQFLLFQILSDYSASNMYGGHLSQEPKFLTGILMWMNQNKIDNEMKCFICSFQFWHFHRFCRLSGNTVWPRKLQAFKLDYFRHFQWTFVHSR